MNYPAGPQDSRPRQVVIIIVAYNVGCVVVVIVRVCRAISSVDLLIAANDGSADDTGRVARAAGAVVVRHSAECGRALAIEVGTEVAAMRDRPDGPPRHILLPSSDLSGPMVEATAFVEAVLARQTGMAIAVPTTGREYSGYGLDVVRRLIRHKTDWNCHYSFNYQRCLTRKAIDAAMPSNDRYVLEASTTINALRAGSSVMEVPCNFAHSGADRLLDSLNRSAHMFDAVHATVSQLFHFDTRSKHRVDHEQEIGVSHPASTSTCNEAEASDPPDTRHTETVG